MKAFVESQFGYCPLIWMFHSRVLNNKINCIHERALRITYKDKYSTFQEQLKKDNSVSIHHRNVQKLAIEIYKVLHGFSPPILNDIFVPVSRPYNFRWNDTLQRRRVNSVRHGTESILFFGSKILDLVPSDIKLSQSLSIFIRKIKKWVPLQCPCRLSKIYLQHVRLIQWPPKNSLHRNRGVLLSVSLSNVWVNVCVSASLFTVIWEIFSGKIAFPVQWQKWRQLALCYYCRGYTKVFLCKWVILGQL